MKKATCLSFLFMGRCSFIFAQENFVNLTITLKNNKGGFYQYQIVNFKATSDGKTYKSSTNDQGIALFQLPTKDVYTLNIANYSRKKEIRVPDIPVGSMSNVFSYAQNMAAMH
jgi:hypothetical protein